MPEEPREHPAAEKAMRVPIVFALTLEAIARAPVIPGPCAPSTPGIEQPKRDIDMER